MFKFQIEEALHASSLQVPWRHVPFNSLLIDFSISIALRFSIIYFIFRPPRISEMLVEELDANEKQAFLNWRRMFVRLAFFV